MAGQVSMIKVIIMLQYLFDKVHQPTALTAIVVIIPLEWLMTILLP